MENKQPDYQTHQRQEQQENLKMTIDNALKDEQQTSSALQSNKSAETGQFIKPDLQQSSEQPITEQPTVIGPQLDQQLKIDKSSVESDEKKAGEAIRAKLPKTKSSTLLFASAVAEDTRDILDDVCYDSYYRQTKKEAAVVSEVPKRRTESSTLVSCLNAEMVEKLHVTSMHIQEQNNVSHDQFCALVRDSNNCNFPFSLISSPSIDNPLHDIPSKETLKKFDEKPQKSSMRDKDKQRTDKSKSKSTGSTLHFSDEGNPACTSSNDRLQDPSSK